MSTVVVFGTRPEIIKLAPIIQQLDCDVVHTGQHKELAQQALDIFNITPDYELNLMKQGQPLEEMIAKGIVKLYPIIQKYDKVVVQGDTASAFCAALTGALQKKQVSHVEAGLRSFNREHPFPEEDMRVMIDFLAHQHFCPTHDAVTNLQSIGISTGKLSGNTIVDALNQIKPTLSNQRPYKGRYVLATVHRREAFGEPIKNIFHALTELTSKVRVVMPVHLNPEVQKAKDYAEEYSSGSSRDITIHSPMDYKEMLWYMKHAEFIITDSGGLQEEAPSFGKPVLILRQATERPAILEYGFGELVGWKKNDIIERAEYMLENAKHIKEKITLNPYGDGKSAERIAQWILSQETGKSELR